MAGRQAGFERAARGAGGRGYVCWGCGRTKSAGLRWRRSSDGPPTFPASAPPPQLLLPPLPLLLHQQSPWPQKQQLEWVMVSSRCRLREGTLGVLLRQKRTHTERLNQRRGSRLLKHIRRRRRRWVAKGWSKVWSTALVYFPVSNALLSPQSTHTRAPATARPRANTPPAKRISIKPDFDCALS